MLSSFCFFQFLRINNGSVEVDSSIMGNQQEGKKIKVPLNSRYTVRFVFMLSSLYSMLWVSYNFVVIAYLPVTNCSRRYVISILKLWCRFPFGSFFLPFMRFYSAAHFLTVLAFGMNFCLLFLLLFEYLFCTLRIGSAPKSNFNETRLCGSHNRSKLPHKSGMVLLYFSKCYCSCG